jgi:hypothetical protein
LSIRIFHFFIQISINFILFNNNTVASRLLGTRKYLFFPLTVTGIHHHLYFGGETMANILKRENIFNNPEDGKYPGILLGANQTLISTKNGVKESLNFDVSVEVDEGVEIPLRFNLFVNWYSQSKFVKTLESLDLLDSEEIDLDQVLQMPVIVEVKNNHTEDGRVYSNIVSIIKDKNREHKKVDRAISRKAGNLFEDD